MNCAPCQRPFKNWFSIAWLHEIDDIDEIDIKTKLTPSPTPAARWKHEPCRATYLLIYFLRQATITTSLLTCMGMNALENDELVNYRTVEGVTEYCAIE